jgi:Tfp pilus assembly protein PilX
MKRDERGIALVITLFLMASLSALAVSMMFLSNTETAASRNYRTMSQARYAAEAGVHEMANYLMTPTGFVPTANIDTTKSPVTCTGGSCAQTAGAGGCTAYSTIALAVQNGCVVLGYSSATTNNPTATVHTPTTSTLAVNASGTTSNAAMGTVTYRAAAILLYQQTISVYGTSPGTIQTWLVISEGTVPPSTSAIVEVSATIERQIGNAETYAVFATNPSCGAITISGNAATDSYNSKNALDMSTNPPTHTGTQGGIGTNGNLNVSGSVNIGGKLTTPRTGAGACSNANPNAVTGTGSWTYGGTVPVPQALSYPTPAAPTPTPPITNITLSAGMGAIACTAAVSGSGFGCTITGSTVTLTPLTSTKLTLGNVTVGSNTNLVFAGTAPTFNVNSFLLGSNATLSMSDGAPPTTLPTYLTMNIAGNSLGSTEPLDLSGGGTVNPSFDPSRLQITYAGTGDLVLVGNNTVAATIYAPNAAAKTTGSGNLYGSILSSTFEDTGGASIHYDSSLMTQFKTLGNFVLTSFSWKKY